MLHCCGQKFNCERMITPLDNDKYTNRSLEVGRCPKCGALICELIQYSRKLNKFITVRPRKKDTQKFIRQIETEPYQEKVYRIRQGSKSNMSWMTFDGLISNWVYDFNGIKQFKQDENLLITFH